MMQEWLTSKSAQIIFNLFDGLELCFIHLWKIGDGLELSFLMCGNKIKGTHLDRCILFSVYWPLPCVSSSHGSFVTTSTPSPFSLCSLLCLAIIYNCPILYWKCKIPVWNYHQRQIDIECYEFWGIPLKVVDSSGLEN